MVGGGGGTNRKKSDSYMNFFKNMNQGSNAIKGIHNSNSELKYKKCLDSKSPKILNSGFSNRQLLGSALLIKNQLLKKGIFPANNEKRSHRARQAFDPFGSLHYSDLFCLPPILVGLYLLRPQAHVLFFT